MNLGYTFLIASLVGFGMLGILHKVADHPDCRPRMITMLLLIWGAVLTAAYTLALEPHGLHMPPAVLGMGTAAGALASLALFAFQASLRHGKISTSWLVLNLCVAVPLLISVLVYGEAVTIGKSIGLSMVFGAIFLMWWDKRIDLARTHGEVVATDTGAAVVATEEHPLPSDSTSDAHGTIKLNYASASARSKSKWLVLIMLAFLANGLAASSQKVLVELGGGAYAWQFYVMLYASGAFIMAIANAMRSGMPNAREMAIAGGMAVASVAGNISIVKALALNVPGSIAYPVANGGSLFLVVLAGVLAFRERVSLFGLAGIALGIAAVLVLVLV